MASAENTGIIWEHFREGLKSFILSKVKNQADSEDILHEVFIRMHDNIGKLNDRAKIKSWLYQVTRNLIIDHFRNRKFDKQQNVYHLPVKDHNQVIMDEAVSDMIKMMNNLSPEYCEALCLTELEGMSQKEYAVKAGLSYSGAKSRIQRARVMLRNMLLDCCHYEFDRYGTVYNIEPSCCRCCPVGKDRL